jgi:hypothetical protein
MNSYKLYSNINLFKRIYIEIYMGIVPNKLKAPLSNLESQTSIESGILSFSKINDTLAYPSLLMAAISKSFLERSVSIYAFARS